MPADSLTVNNKKRVQTYKLQATSNTEKASTSVTVPIVSAKVVAPVDTLQISKPKQVKAKTTQSKQEKSSWIDTACDVVGDVGAGIAGTVFGPLVGAAVGAGLKAGIGFVKAKAQGKKYTVKNFTHDLIMGAANGALGAVTLGMGGAVAKGVTKSLAKVLVKEGSKKTATFIVKEGTIGAAFGAGNEIARQTSDKITDKKDYHFGHIALATGEGALLGPIMAKGFQVVGKGVNSLLKPLGKVFKGKSSSKAVGSATPKATTEIITEDAVSTKGARLGEHTTSIDRIKTNSINETMSMVSTNRRINIGIIDIFGKKKGIPINGSKSDYTHGELTSAVLKRLTRDINSDIIRIPVKQRLGEKNSFDLKSLLKQLKKINTNGIHYDYLNISGSLPIEYSLLGLSEGGLELTQKEVLENIRKEIAKVTYSNGKVKFLESGEGKVIHIINELERIAAEGTKIFISSSNKKNKFNVFSLAKGVHTVGACDGVTKRPLKRFANYPLIETYANLPVYITNSQKIVNETTKTALNLNGIIPIYSTLAKLSKKELLKKVATKTDYEKLKHIVDKLYATGKFKFDIDFLRFKLVSSVEPSMRNKIYDINKFKEIFAGKFDEEVLRYTMPAGTHCDLMFRQFFDMTSRNQHVISMHKTTKIPNTCSGTSFAAPQGLLKRLQSDIAQSN